MTEERKLLAKMIDKSCYMMGYVSEFYEGKEATEAVIRWHNAGEGALHLWCSACGYYLEDFTTELECLDSTRDAMLSKINRKDASCNDQ